MKINTQNQFAVSHVMTLSPFGFRRHLKTAAALKLYWDGFLSPLPSS